MGGPRDFDWRHTHVLGNRDAGVPYLDFAAKLLGEVKAEAARNGLGVYTLRRQLADGASVQAEIHGAIPRITIVPPPRAPVTPTLIGDFVVTPRDVEHPNGLDTVHPEDVLRHFDKSTWIDFKFDNYDQPAFPHGLGAAGTQDWEGRSGERLSWYGPTLRYWCDLYRNATAQYGRFVFTLGSVLLDLDAYQTAVGFTMGGFVTGAALRNGWLYVTLAGLADVNPGIPVGRGGDTFVRIPYLNGTIGMQVWRFRVVHHPDAIAGELRYAVVVGSGERLLNTTVSAGSNPWVFSPDARRAECFTYPPLPSIRRYRDNADVYQWDEPSPGHAHLTLDINEAGDAAVLSSETLTLSLTADSAECAIAADWDRFGNRLELVLVMERARAAPALDIDPESYPDVGLWHRFSLRLGADRIALYEPGERGLIGAWTVLLALDLRHGAAMGVRRAHVSSPATLTEELVGYHRGKLAYTKLTATRTFDTVPDAPTASMQLLARQHNIFALSPFSFLVGAAIFGDYGHPPGAPSPVQGYNRTAFALPYYYQDHAQAWGSIGIYNATDGTSLLIATTIADFIPADQFGSQPADARGHASPLGLAADEDVLMFSGPAGLSNWSSGTHSPHYLASGTDLSTLTGAVGTTPRFHPLWRLGKPLPL